MLPSSNVPETARITRIVHTADDESPFLTYVDDAGAPQRIIGEPFIRKDVLYAPPTLAFVMRLACKSGFPSPAE